jgi:hypothetical protein
MKENLKGLLDRETKSILRTLKSVESKKYCGSKWGASLHSIDIKIKAKAK